MTPPRIIVAPHVRELDTPLGRLRAAILYDRFGELITAAGGQPLAAWPGTPAVEDLAALADGIVLVGGGDVAPERFGLETPGDAVDPVRDEFEVRLVLAARNGATPLLGVCRGAQLLNVALGGTLRRVEGHRQTEPLARATHRVSVAESTRLAAALGTAELEVNSFHDWTAARLGAGLRESASAGGVTEGLEAEGNWWALGVQWHLELLDDQAGAGVFAALVAEAQRRS